MLDCLTEKKNEKERRGKIERARARKK